MRGVQAVTVTPVLASVLPVSVPFPSMGQASSAPPPVSSVAGQQSVSSNPQGGTPTTTITRRKAFEIDLDDTPTAPRLIFSVEDDFEGEGSGTCGGDVIHIGQVGAQVGAASVGPSIFNMNNPIAQLLYKNLTIPKFTGKGEDWPLFVSEWENFLIKGSQGQDINNSTKLDLLEAAMDETNKKLLRSRRMEKGGRASYNEEFANLRTKFSKFEGIGARRKWEEVQLHQQGKVTMSEWENFQVDFMTGLRSVKDTNEGEARRILFSKIPRFIANWVTEEEDRKMNTNPLVTMNVPTPPL